MALPSLGRNVKAAWSVSYAEAARYGQLKEKVQAKDNSVFEVGNHDSTQFFQKMDASFAEAERMRKHLRYASSVSKARGQAEKVSIEHTNRSVEAAQAMASFAQGAAGPHWSSRGLEGHERSLAVVRREVLHDVPPTLAHLMVPRRVHEDAPADASELSLPGAVDDGEAAGAGAAPWLPEFGSLGEATLLLPLAEADETPSGAPTPTPRSAARFAPATPRELKGDETGSTAVPSPKPVAQLAVATPRDRKEDKLSTPQEARRSSDASDSSHFGSSGSSAQEQEGTSGWPPRPPLLRFKMLMQFSSRFKPSEDKALFQAVNEGVSNKLQEKERKEMKDITVAWLNTVFQLTITTEFEFEVGYPIILLTMLDAIYPKRVRWREVDWRVAYTAALAKNYRVLHTIWGEVNMDKAREFRADNSSVRMENMPTANTQDKLVFARLMRKWFLHRIDGAPPYDAMAKRREMVEQLRIVGVRVTFPSWICFDKEAPPVVVQTAYEKKPEFERLIHFLGSVEHQTM